MAGSPTLVYSIDDPFVHIKLLDVSMASGGREQRLNRTKL